MDRKRLAAAKRFEAARLGVYICGRCHVGVIGSPHEHQAEWVADRDARANCRHLWQMVVAPSDTVSDEHCRFIEKVMRLRRRVHEKKNG